ncbi:probable G-protein coupled receptor 139 [Chiloscyllium plagiosum]|uniref:probable G-protein coupled receptor 139 n=1 Tax=Chiloscyllium plagiosum TaxID=36176 RepID=UPI001CB7F995|nr:probable G-protein coupled receptor 139 [Chiloscyllium plagiosum]
MAAADLMVIIAEVVLGQFRYYYFPLGFLDITPVCSVTYFLARAAADCSIWYTVTLTFDRFVLICCQNLKTKYYTNKTAGVVLATTSLLLCSKNVPFYCAYEPGMIIDNVPWYCHTKPSYYSDPAWLGFDWLDTVLTPLLPFTLILLLNALRVQYILMYSRVRKCLKVHGKGRDIEMESRKKSAILLFTISGSFILLWLNRVIYFICYRITGTDPLNYNSSSYVFGEIGLMLRNLSCCTNTVIYGVTQAKFREQLKIAVKYLYTTIIQFLTKQHN